jgi:uroporphyrinogen decarboxylase
MLRIFDHFAIIESMFVHFLTNIAVLLSTKNEIFRSFGMALSSKERVYRTLNHEEPDRVPLALGGGPYGLVDEVYLMMVDYFNLGDPVPPFRSGHSISYMDDRIFDKLETDIRYTYPNLLPNSPILPGDTPETFKDSYGQIWHKAQPYYYAGTGILSQIRPEENIDQFLTFPNPEDPKWMKGVAERAKYLHDVTDCFIAMRMVASHGPFQTACDLRGGENFLMDMSLYPDFAQELLNRISDFQVGLFRQALKAGGQYFDMIELPGDDYASNLGTLISPRMFRKFIKPILSRFVEVIRSYQPKIYIMFHSDGLITSLLDDLIDIGISVIHPLEPLPGVDFVEIKKRFGNQVSFLGAIDISHALPGSQADVISEVKTRIQQLAPGGGYILAPSNHIQADVPPENVETLYRAAKKLGAYPIQ